MAPNELFFYYHNDHLGTPRMLVYQTSEIYWQADYTPFGEIANYVSNFLPPNLDQPFRFPGQYADTLTGLYYNWNRYYMPEVGRYNRVDILNYDLLYLLHNYALINYSSRSDNKLEYRSANYPIFMTPNGILYYFDNYLYLHNNLNRYQYTSQNPIILYDLDSMKPNRGNPPPAGCVCQGLIRISKCCKIGVIVCGEWQGGPKPTGGGGCITCEN